MGDISNPATYEFQLKWDESKWAYYVVNYQDLYFDYQSEIAYQYFILQVDGFNKASLTRRVDGDGSYTSTTTGGGNGPLSYETADGIKSLGQVSLVADLSVNTNKGIFLYIYEL